MKVITDGRVVAERREPVAAWIDGLYPTLLIRSNHGDTAYRIFDDRSGSDDYIWDEVIEQNKQYKITYYYPGDRITIEF